VSWVWINGAVTALQDARIGVEDRGFLLGQSAFETLRLDGTSLRRWERHRARLEAGLAFLGIAAPGVLEAAPRAAAQLSERLDINDGIARLTVSAGEGGAGLEGRPGAAPHVVMTLKPRPAPPAGVSVAVLDQPRRGGLPSEGFKLSGYSGLIEARREARSRGADRAVVTSSAGGVLACADCANLFWIKDDVVVTPAISAGALPGTARAALLRAAKAQGLEIKEVNAPPQRLYEADAAFMTNAVEGVVPITKINALMVKTGHPMVSALRALEMQAD
jgi:branched-chain amino acid aminotransferase